MKNLVFILWLILFPLSTSIGTFLSRISGNQKEYSENTEAISSLIILIIWVFVSTLLFEK